MTKYSLKNIKAYLQGNIRYELYYSERWKWLIPEHIKEQIEVRIKSMDRQCFNDGSCKICGCKTTNLQMANIACEGDCYPVMVSRSRWKYLKEGNIMVIQDKLWKIKDGLFKSIGK